MMKAIGLNIPRDQWSSTTGLSTLTLPTPQISDPHDVIIAPLFAGFCGSDRNVWFRQGFESLIYDALEGDSRTLGHEFMGRILKVGSAVTQSTDFKPGDLVSSESHVFCGKCTFCKQGQAHVCIRDQIIGFTRDGAFAQAIKLPSKILWPVNSDKIALEVAALMEPIGNAVHVCSATDIKNKNVAIFGCGPIGLFSLLIAKALGAKRILGIEPNPKHAELAKHLGADEVIICDPALSNESPYFDDALVRSIQHFFDDEGPDVAFEMAGHNSSVNHAIAATKRCGHTVLFGLKSGPYTLPGFTNIIMHGKQLHGIIGRRLFETWQQTQAILEDKSNGVQEAILTHMIPKDAIVDFDTFDPEVFESLMKTHPKLMFRFPDNMNK